MESLKIHGSSFLKDTKEATRGLVDQSNLAKESSLMSLDLEGNAQRCTLQSSAISSLWGNVSEVLDISKAVLRNFIVSLMKMCFVSSQKININLRVSSNQK